MKRSAECERALENRKAAVFACLAFDADPGDLGPATAVWRRLCEGRLGQAEIEIHIDSLLKRSTGVSLAERAAARGAAASSLKAPPSFVEEYGLRSVPVGPITVSVDLFNPADELALGTACGRNVVEVFRVLGHDAEAFVDVVHDLFEKSEATGVFGGASFYLDMLIQLRHGPEPEIGASDLLWPITARHDLAIERVEKLPLHRVLKGRSPLLQVFEDLWTGPHTKYETAAKALGLRNFWEWMR